MIGGAVVPQAMWARTFPKHGQLIACRAVLRKSALQLVAIAALSYFTAGWGASLAGAMGMGAAAGSALIFRRIVAFQWPATSREISR